MPREHTRMSSDSRKRASAPAAAEAGDERARATGESALTAAADETNLGDAGSLAAFEKWCVDRGFVLHAALELRDVTPPGSTRVSNAAFASADVRVGDVLVDIPKAWCLTPLTGSVSLAVPEEDLADLDEAALILAVMYERARGEASAWWPYFRRLPRDHEPIPLMWSDDDKKHLAGTDVASRLKSDAPALREDHARIMDACRAHAARLPAFFPDGIAPESLHDDPVLVSPESRNPLIREGDEKTNDAESLAESLSDAPRLEVEDGPFGFRAFLAAASLVASRAFHVDDAHGQGLVPVADLFNHAGGGGEHVHFEGEGDEGDFRHSIRDENEDADESLSESDDARVEAEMRRLAAEDDLISPSRAKETLTFEAFEALEKRGGAKLASNPTTYGDGEEEEEEDGEWESDPNASRTSDALRLVAVASARRGDELFNAFGDHGNALLLHKYGFVEWANAASSGGVAISPEQLCELIGSSEVYFEAFAALEGAFASDDEASDTSDDENDEKAPWDSAADRAHPGAAAARAAGWSGGKYELSASGELSRDLLLLLAVALADGDEDDAFFQKTGLPPGLERRDDEGLLRTPGVAEAALAAIKTRLAALPRGDVTSDLATARELAAREGREGRGEEPNGAAPNGVAGVPAAFVLRADERATCEKALARLVRWLRRVVSGDAKTDARTERTDVSGDDEDAIRRVRPRLTDVVPLQDTPYGAVVYLPKRDSFSRGRKEKEAMTDD